MMLKIFSLILCLFIINSAVDGRDVKSAACRVDKMTENQEYDAVGEALGAVRTNPLNVVRKATRGPYTAYARGGCVAPGDCRGCISELVDKIWDICQKAKGGKVFYGECVIRYELYPF